MRVVAGAWRRWWLGRRWWWLLPGGGGCCPVAGSSAGEAHRWRLAGFFFSCSYLTNFRKQNAPCLGVLGFVSNRVGVSTTTTIQRAKLYRYNRFGRSLTNLGAAKVVFFPQPPARRRRFFALSLFFVAALAVSAYNINTNLTAALAYRCRGGWLL